MQYLFHILRLMGSTYISAFSSSPPARDLDPVAKIDPERRLRVSY